MVSNQSHSMWVLVSGKGAFCLLPFHNLLELDRQAQSTNEFATIGNCKIIRLMLADDLVLLSSTESGLQVQRAYDFAAASDIAGMKISTTKTEILYLSRKPDQCSLQVSGENITEIGGELQES